MRDRGRKGGGEGRTCPMSQLIHSRTHLVSTWQYDGVDGVVHADHALPLTAALTAVFHWLRLH